MVKDLSVSDFESITNNIKLPKYDPSKKKMIIEFYISTCPHCISMEPIFLKLSEVHKDIFFYKTEISDKHELAHRFNIEATPTFIFFPQNNEPVKLLGEIGKDEFDNKIKEIFR